MPTTAWGTLYLCNTCGSFIEALSHYDKVMKLVEGSKVHDLMLLWAYCATAIYSIGCRTETDAGIVDQCPDCATATGCATRTRYAASRCSA